MTSFHLDWPQGGGRIRLLSELMRRLGVRSDRFVKPGSIGRADRCIFGDRRGAAFGAGGEKDLSEFGSARTR